jgi:hypothetical protein
MKRLLYKGERGPRVMVIPGAGKVERGKTIDVPDPVARELVERDPANYELAGTKSASEGAVKKKATIPKKDKEV